MRKLALIAAVPMACCALGPTSLLSTQAAYQDQPWWKRTGRRPWRSIGENFPQCSQLPPGLRQILHNKHIVCFAGRHPA